MNEPAILKIRPSAIYAFLQILSWMLLTSGLLFIAWRYYTPIIYLSLFTLIWASCKHLLIMSINQIVKHWCCNKIIII